MNNRSAFLFRMGAGTVATLLVCFLMAGMAQAAGKEPIIAKVGFQLQSVRKVNILTGDFEADFRLSFKCSAECRPSGFLLENGRIMSAVPIIDSPAEKAFLVHAQLTGDIDTRRFPFDIQSLYIQLRAAEDGIRYELDPLATPTELNVAAAEWVPGKHMEIISEAAPAVPGQTPVFRSTFGFTIHRPILESILRYMLPALALMFAAFPVLIVNPDDFKTKLGMALSSFIGQIFLQVSIGGRIPVREYLIFWDKHLIVSYCAVGLIVIYVLVDNTPTLQARAALRKRLTVFARIALPVSWVAMQVWLIMATFRGG